MKKLFSIIMMAALSTAAFAQDATTYGDYKVDESKAKPAAIVEDVLKTDSLVQDLTITGTIDGVCQAKGCWMTIKLPNGQDMTVKFKDYAFFMPKDASGKTVVAHGKAFIKTTSVAELQHLAEDAGKSKKAIRKIKAPKKEMRFEADGVVLKA
jgi:Domain of unknown function (DUF4920)